ncbi:MAG TPA: hypothetical protein VF648_05765 [Pyrinomonadaceae bacterium]|jgi:CubicO group peptidase (beta-lactamase class C family)
MKIKHSFLLIVLIFGLQLPADAQSKSDNVESFLRREMRERKIRGLQAAIVRNGKIVLLKSRSRRHGRKPPVLSFIVLFG